MEPVTKRLRLQELLAEVLQVALAELAISSHSDLGLAILGDGDLVAEVAGLAINLDALQKELLEASDIHDAVIDGGSAVDEELVARHTKKNEATTQGIREGR